MYKNTVSLTQIYVDDKIMKRGKNMEETKVRLTDVTIENFKNVEYGLIGFCNSRKSYKASILGLYGQNGSGKTTLIDVIELLRSLLIGYPVDEKYADYINVDAKEIVITYQFDVSNDKKKYRVYYEITLISKQQEKLQNTDMDEEESHKKVIVSSEILSYAYEDEKTKERKAKLIDTNTTGVFVPQNKYECLVGKDSSISTELLVAKKIVEKESRSFIFSRELLSAIRNNKQEDEEYQRHLLLIESLVRYGNFELFVIGSQNNGMISLNALPLAFKYHCGKLGTVGKIMIPLDKTASIPEEAFSVVKNVVKNMNIVLKQLVPGLTIGVYDLGSFISDKGNKGRKIELVSLKNSKAIPLKYESDGIKKIISVLELLIAVYNQESITVAIDELDAGVFEYLLGELLRIISEKGKGQLIFTSHNLRPLETLDRGFIAFTTTNPQNRYIRLTNIKENNNLRDFYFRDIVLGEQNEEIYDATNNAEIAFAFREAGDFSGT